MNKEQIDKLVEKYQEEISVAKSALSPWLSQVSQRDRQILYSLVREFKPKSVIEYGTYCGSCTYMILAALLKNGSKFKFFASEKEAQLRGVTQNNLRNALGVDFEIHDRVEQCLDKMPKRLDFGWIDHSHQKQDVEFFLDSILPRFKKGALVAIHDWSVRSKGRTWHRDFIPWIETQMLCEMHDKGTLPLQKFYWTGEEHPDWQTAVEISARPNEQAQDTGWFKKT